MISAILKSKKGIKDRLKNLALYISRRRGANRSWDKRHSIVFKKHPEFKVDLPAQIRREHREMWEPFFRRFDDSTLQICHAISGKGDPGIIPEEVFQADIEPSLNSHPEAHFLANKSLYSHWFDGGLFPENLLHNIDGEVIDKDYRSVSDEKLEDIVQTFEYPVIMKPNLDSWGGNKIRFIENYDSLLRNMKDEKNFVVQEKIIQHELLSRLHPPSLNTVRVYLYKSIKDNVTHIVNIAQRMGNGGALDNVASGGLVSLVNEDGKMHGYALDRYGEKYETHPVTGLKFNQDLPEFEKMKSLAIHIASNMFQLRVVGLDLCYDSKGHWKVIEINTKGHSIRFAQYAGKPFFGPLTEEVINYCINHHWAVKQNG